KAAFEPGKEGEADEQPHHPAQETRAAEAVEADDRVATGDGSHTAEVVVLEGLGLLTREPPSDGLCSVNAGLQRDLRHAGEVVEVHHVTDDIHLGVTAQRAVGFDLDPARAVEFRARRLRLDLGERRGRDARSPDRRLRPVSLVRAGRTLHIDTVRIHTGHDRAGLHFDPAPFERLPRPFRQPVTEDARISLPPSNRTTLTSAGSKRRKLSFKARLASSAICPEISTPVGPPPTTTKVSHARRESISSSSSAISKAPKIRSRCTSASARVFMPGAHSVNSS